jgi:hypothetical protein
MSKPKPVTSAIHLMYGAQSLFVQVPNPTHFERFPGGGGWAVTVSRSPRIRAAYASNTAKRDGAVADLKQVCRDNKLLVWGIYENQRSKLSYTHDKPDCRGVGKVFQGAAAKLARGRLACGCNRQAAAARRALDVSAAARLARRRGGKLLSVSYKNNATPLQWKCAQGHEFSMSQSDASRGRWCPHCAGSRANALCKVILERLLSVQFIAEDTPAFLAKASEEAGLAGVLRFDGWSEAERIAFEHQGPQHYEPVVRNNTADGRPNVEAARRKHVLGTKYDAIKVWACAGQATLIVIPDISVRGYGYARSKKVVATIVLAVRAALPAARLDGAFEAAVEDLQALDRAGWQQLIEPMFAGSTRIQRLRRLATSKGGRVVSVTDDNNAVFECGHGHQWRAQINNVLGGTWCPIEGVKLRATSRRLSVPAIRARLKSIGLHLGWSDEEAQAKYKNNQTAVPVIRVACGGRFTRRVGKLHEGSRCPGCKGKPMCNGHTRRHKRGPTLH